MNIRASLCVAACCALAACATGPKFADVQATLPKVPDGDGRVYFYRTQVFGAAVQPTIWLNGQKVGDCAPQGVYVRDLPAGSYNVHVETEVERELTFTLGAGEEKFVRCYISMGIFIGHGNLELADPTEARDEVRGLAYQK